MLKPFRLCTIFFLAALLPAVGCQQSPPPTVNHGEVIAPDEQVMTMRRIADIQADGGAHNDATLYACHFDGQYLNSLGIAKLDRMLKDDSDLPLAVWLSIPQDERFEARRLSVAAYLKMRGLGTEQVSFNPGGNPDTDHPAADELKNLSKTDTGSSTGSSGSSNSSASSAAGTPGQP
jgi:hypothetical protein